MRDVAALGKDKSGDKPPCLEVIALLHLSGYRFRFRREAVGFKPDSRFRPFFWKEDGDDDSHGFEEERDDAGTDVTPETTHMDVGYSGGVDPF
jgi:hypothetical protein